MKSYFIGCLVLAFSCVYADVSISTFSQGAVESDGAGDSQTFSYQSTDIKADILQKKFAEQKNTDFSFYKIYANYGYTRLEWEPQIFELESYGLGLTLGEINLGKGRWSYLANAHSSLRQQRGVSRGFEDIRTTGFVLGTYSVKEPWWGESLSWSVGFAYLDLSDGEGIIPIAGFKWKLNEDWLIQSKSTTISSHYKINNKWQWKSIIERKNYTWDIEEGEVRWAAFHTGTGFTYEIKEDFSAEILTGINFGSEAEITGAGNLDRERDTDSGLWARLSLKYKY